MPPSSPRPIRQLPRGVSLGLWDYIHSYRIADDYDDYFAFNGLFDFDEELLIEHFTQSPTEGKLLVDLGCGTGRALLPLVRRGLRGLAVDMSRPMLEIVQDKAELDALPIDCLEANLVELDAVADQVADYCMCMFSTLGMIQGRAARRQMLGHTFRILKPGGLFILHVHNVWRNLLDPDALSWALAILRCAVDRRAEIGDKYFPYRGVPNMYLHSYRRGELVRDLQHANFQVQRIIPLDTVRRHPLRLPWLLGRLRANGWIVVCRVPP